MRFIHIAFLILATIVIYIRIGTVADSQYHSLKTILENQEKVQTKTSVINSTSEDYRILELLQDISSLKNGLSNITRLNYKKQKDSVSILPKSSQEDWQILEKYIKEDYNADDIKAEINKLDKIKSAKSGLLSKLNGIFSFDTIDQNQSSEDLEKNIQRNIHSILTSNALTKCYPEHLIEDDNQYKAYKNIIKRNQFICLINNIVFKVLNEKRHN